MHTPLSVFCAPLRYVQGPAAMTRLAAEMEAVGLAGPVLVVAGSGTIGRLAPTWAAAFAEQGWVHRVLAFGGESSRREIAAIVAEATSLGARAIVGAGGGKVLDAARSAAAALRLPFVSVPTICSTDAPTSALSVIYHDDGPQRGTVEAYEIHRRSPDLVLVDTRVIAESPPRFLAAGVGDALSTFYEARAAVASGSPTMRGGRSTRAAFELARLCRDVVFAHAVEALEECRQRRAGMALEQVCEAATLLSGLGFESSGLAAAHAIHNGLTVCPETHAALHGEKVAFGTIAQLMLEAAAGNAAGPREEAKRVAELCVRLGLPVTLGELGLAAATAADLGRISERATAAGETIHHMPFPVTAAMVIAALASADELGRTVLAAVR